jgi:two-component system NarL family response regulator
MPESRRIRVVIVDDHSLLREGLAAVLKRHHDLDVVGEAASGGEALITFRRLRPDVTIIDLRLGDMPGVDVIRDLRKDYPDAHFVVLTTYDTSEDAYRAFSAGAAAYLLKDAPGEEVVQAIRQVFAGEKLVPPELAASLQYSRLHIGLSERERAVLQLVAEGKTNREIATVLGISSDTVKTYLDRMRAKLSASDRAALVATAIKLGFLQT